MKNKSKPTFYVYIYTYSNGVAYYVGKGCRHRSTAKAAHKAHNIVTPDKSQIQEFFFDTQAEMLATEAALVEFFGRECNGTGTLKNRAIGGTIGTTGMVVSQATRKKISIKNKGAGNGMYGKTEHLHHRAQQYAVTHPDGTITKCYGLRQFALRNDLNYKCLNRVALGQRAHHRGYTVKRATH